MDSPLPLRPPPRERLLELDQALRQAIDRRDGEAARQIAKRQARELQDVARGRPDDGGAWLREAADRLRDLVVRAQAAQNALGAEIAGLAIQRKLMGAPAAVQGPRSGRSFRA